MGANFGTTLPSLLTAGVSGITGATVNVLGSDGLLTVNIPNVPQGNSTLTVSLSAVGVEVATLPINIQGIAGPVLNDLTGSLIGSALNLATCPVGNPLSYTLANGTAGAGNLTLTADLANTQVTVACQGSPCPPTTITLPNVTAALNVLGLPASICVNSAPLSLTLVPTGISLATTGLTVSASTPTGALTVSALGADGVVSISGGNLTVGDDVPITISIGLGSTTLVSTTVTLDILPTDTFTPNPLLGSSTLGSVLNLGTCALGGTLSYTVLSGSLANTIGSGGLTLDAALNGQQVAVSCTGACSSSATTLTLPNITTALGVLGVPASICVNSAPLSLTLVPTGVSLATTGLTVSASTPSGALTVSALGADGIVSISGGNLTVGSNVPITISLGLGSTTLVSTTVNLNVLPQATFTPGSLSGSLLGSVLNLGACSTGLLSYTLADGSTGTGSLSLTTALAGQGVTVACAGPGVCPSAPTLVTLPSVTPTLSLSNLPNSVCVDLPINLNLLPTGIDLTNPLIAVTASTTSGTLAVSALGAGGALSITGGQLTVGEDQPVSITVSLAGVPLVSTSFTIDVIRAEIPDQPLPQSLTATVGSVLSLTGLCPTGTLVNLSNPGDLSGIINIPTTAAGVQSLSILCNANGCLSPIRVVGATVLPALIGLLSNSPVCLNQPLSLTVLPTNLDLNLVNVAVTGPVGLSASALDGNGVLTVTGLVSGVNNLTVTASVGGAIVASGTIDVTAYPVPDPVAVASLTVLEGTTLSLTALCPTGVVSTSGLGGITPLLSLPPTTVGVQVLPLLCAGQGTCVSPITSVTVITVPVPVPPIGINPSSLSICVGDPLSLTVTGLEAITLPFGLSVVGAPFTSLDVRNNVLTITGLPSGTANLTVNAGLTIAGIPVVASQTVSITVFDVPTAPTVVTQGGQTYPAGVSSLSVTQNSSNVLFNASCTTGTLSYTSNTGAVSSTSPITVPTAATGVFSYSAVCINGACTSPTTVVSVTVVAPTPNQAPVVANRIPDQTGTVGVAYAYTIPAGTFTDPEGQSLTLAVGNLPAGLSFDPATNVISGTPTTAQNNLVTVTATDPGGATTSTTFNFTINPAANQAPVVANRIPDQTGTVGVAYAYTIPAGTFTDPEGQSLTLAVGNLPAGLSFNPTTNVISGTPTTAQNNLVTVTATDPQGATTSTTFNFTINPAANQAPVVANRIPDQTGTVGVAYAYTIPAGTFTDPEGQSLTLAVGNLPAGLSFNPTTNVISGTPTTAQNNVVTVTATDPQGATTSTTFNFTINPAANQAPVVANRIPDQTGTVGVAYAYTIPAGTFTDPEGQSLTLAVGNLPAGLSFNPTTNVISGTPTTAQNNLVTVTATDPQGATTSTTFNFTINPAPNQAPIVANTIPPQSGTVGVGVNFPIPAGTFTDPNGDPITVTVTNLPPGLTFDPGTTAIVGTPTTPGVTQVTVTGTDPGGASVSTSFPFTIQPNQAPVLSQSLTSPVNATVGVGVNIPTAYAFRDPEGLPLTFSSPNLPAALTINGATGVITGAPSTSGSFGVTITATDSQGQTASGNFTLNVVPQPVGNQAPIVANTIPPQSGTVGVGVNFPIPAGTFTDPNGDPITVTVTNLPPGLTFDPGTTAIVGTPTTPGVTQVTVTGTDPGGASVSTSFPFTIQPNQAPVLSQSLTSPVNATVGVGVNIPTAYAFRDPEGLPLTFSSPNLPAALTINGATGVITGAPSTSGSFGVTITATDSQGQTASGNFTLNVVPQPVGNQAPIVANTIPPQSGTVGVGVNFPIPAGTFTDPNGDPITVTVTNLPPGLTFDPGTTAIVGTPTTPGVTQVTVTGTDPGGASVSTSFPFTIQPNQAPVLSQSLTSPVNATVGVGVNIPTAYAFRDPEGLPLTFSSPGLPANLVIDPATGIITGAPSTSGSFGVTITATDSQGQTASGNFTLNVVPQPVGNQAPIVANTIPPQSGTVGVGVNFPIPAGTFTDPNGDPITVTVTNLPPGLTFDPGTTAIVGTPTTPGVTQVTVTGTDPGGASVSTSFPFTIQPNQAPVLSQSLTSPVNATVGVGVNIPTAYAFRDPEGLPLTFSSPNLPAALTINGATGVITGAPSTSGSFGVTITATDSQGQTASGNFTLNVVPQPVGNQAPIVANTIPPQSGTVGVGVNFPIPAGTFTDPNGDPITVTVTNLPPGLTFDPGTTAIVGTPTTPGVTQVTVTGTDPGGASVSTSFPFTIQPNQAPVLSQSLTSPVNATVGVGVNIPTAYAFRDPEGLPLTFSSPNLPAALTINGATGVITGAPSTSGSFGVTITATDSQGQTASGNFTLNVVPQPVGNQAPIVANTIPPQSGTVGVGVNFPIPAGTFTDPNGDPITVTVTNLPPGLTFDPGTTAIVGTPTTPGVTQVTVTGTDPGGASVSTSFPFTIQPNQAPVLSQSLTSPVNATVGVGVNILTAYAFRDPEGLPLTFSSPNLPAALTINGATGVITGAPSTSGSFGVTITATDSQGQTASGNFTLNVVPQPVGNQAPIVANTIPPQSGTVGVGVNFPIPAGTFTDPNGDPITVTVTNLPPGLTFDPGTTAIVGTPTTPGVTQVTVTGTDPGGASVSTTFPFTVVPAQTAPFAITGVTPINCQTVTAGLRTFTFTPLYAGLNGQPILFSVVNEMVPTYASGPYTLNLYTDNPVITLRAEQAGSPVSTFTFNWLTICNGGTGNQAPIVANPIGPQSGTVGVGVNFPIPTGTFTDPNGDPITVTVTNLPPGLTFDPGTTAIVGTPTTPGTTTVVVTATDPSGSSVTTTFPFTVVPATPGNQAPVVANPIGPQSGTVGVGVNFPIPTGTFTDPNGDPITVTVTNLPPGLTFDPGTTAIVGTPTTPGTTTVVVTATDPSGSSVTTTFPFTVVPATPGNQSPIVVTPIGPQSGTVGVGFTLVIPGTTFSDPEGQPLTVSVSNLPPGLTFDPGTTAIVGTPTAPGTTLVTVTATDPSGATVSTSFVLTISPAAVQPPLNCGSNLDGTPLRATMPMYDCERIRTTGEIQFMAAGGNPNGGPIEFKAYGITDWTTTCTETIDFETRTFCDAPPIEILIRQLVNGTYVYGTSYIFNIRQACPSPGCPRPTNNRAPVVNAGIPDQYARVGQIFDYDIQPNAFTDPDGDALLYTISPRLPDSFTYSTGHFHALPLEPATYTISVMAHDNSGAAVITTFRIFVLPSNTTTPQPPVTTPQPPVTTPQPPVAGNCGSSSLDGSALRATMPTYDCAQLTTTGAIRFTAMGGNPNGGTVEFRAVGVTDWTSNCNVNLDNAIRTACDAPVIPIQVRQLVNGTYVYGQTFMFNVRQACPIAGCSNARIAAPAFTEIPLDVTVLGNPVEGESAQIEIRGAEGQSVRMLMTNSSGYPVSEQVIDNAQATERQTLKLGATGGVYLLRVSTPTQVKTVKVVKQ
ncbi:putative Ig domain-containing protein [Spirosoma sp. KUDC1026]|uniref:putative Ig domain-containing protein n=1 Tax=Spirosoma sp. KUDC1026 TaxID=2745947 RepID=UPI00159B88A7|nr:putative Ig domain-containing protein [Spirosoma sp. KUDC1026]QKZ14731.1 putative Ig domain-containing protein [Spirosoma sp. KUDC1026]